MKIGERQKGGPAKLKAETGTAGVGMSTGRKTGGRTKGTTGQTTGEEAPGGEFLPLHGRTRARAVQPPSKPLPAAAKRPAHRPAYEPTERDRKTVKIMAAGGIKQDQIGEVLGISSRTMRKYFSREISTAANTANASVVASLYWLATTGKNVNAAKWWTQARMGWSERLVVQEAVLEDVDPATLTDAELAARIAYFDRPKRSRALKRLPGSDDLDKP